MTTTLIARRRFVIDVSAIAALLLAVVIVFAVDRSTPVKLDLVFVLDQRSEMRDLISGMKSRCAEMAEGLKAGGVNCRFAVIPFGQKRRRVPVVPFTDSAVAFKNQLVGMDVPEDPNAAATAVEALRRALSLDFRKDAQVLFYLISNDPCADGTSVKILADQMAARGITTIVQADAERKGCWQKLYGHGRFFSMDGVDLSGGAGSELSRDTTRAANMLAQLAVSKSQLGTVKGIYSERTNPNRRKMIAQLGGTAESEAAVQAGLEWLARHQAEDGHWSDPKRCEHDQPCSDIQYGAPLAETGLAVLAFQAGGHYDFNDQEYSRNVKSGLDWIVEQQHEDGRLFGSHTWYEHGIATFALAEACAVALASDRSPDPRYLLAAQRAIKFMEQHQYTGGGWRYDLGSDSSGDASVTGWQVLALKSAMEAKIELSPMTLERVAKFYEMLGDPETGRTGYQSRGSGSDAMMAVGLIVQEFILKQPQSPLALKAAENLKQLASQHIGQTGDFYTLYNGTLAMFLARGESWKVWNQNVRDAIVGRQVKTGCARGSWNHSYHRTLDTAWAVLTLEVYYRYSLE